MGYLLRTYPYISVSSVCLSWNRREDIARSCAVTVTKIKLEKKEVQHILKYLKELKDMGLKGNPRGSVERGTANFDRLEALIQNLELIAPDSATAFYVLERIVSPEVGTSHDPTGDEGTPDLLLSSVAGMTKPRLWS